MPLFYNYGDLSNTSVRVFLYHAGIRYDEKQGYNPLRSKKHVELHKKEALSFQKNKCFYCDNKFSEDFKPERDHIIPMKRATGGMHCWGNILFCCRSCNVEKDKHDGNWKDYLTFKNKLSKYKEWIKKYSNDEKKSAIHALECQDIYKELDIYMRNKVSELLDE